MQTINENTVVMMVETNPHRQTSGVWTGFRTAKEIVSFMYTKNCDMREMLRKNNVKSFNELIAKHGDEYPEHLNEWENSLPFEAHFEAAIDAAKDDGHIINMHFAVESALEAGAPRYMSEEDYVRSCNIIF
jgi:hypothetical protein